MKMMKGDLIEIRKEKSEGRNWNLKICRSVSDTWIIVNRSVGVVRTENRSNLEKVADRYLAIFHSSGFLWENGVKGLINIWPRPTAIAWKIIFCYGAFEAALQLLLPGKRVEGPVSPTGNRPVYKDNGMAAYFVTLATYLGLWWFGIFNPAIVYDH
ncbi:hypothetical protein Bca101_071771 [Brassica carinata]